MDTRLPPDALPVEQDIRIEELAQQIDRLLGALVEAIGQACGVEWLDHDRLLLGHQGLQAYEQAFSILEDLGYIQRVDKDYVLVWPEEW